MSTSRPIDSPARDCLRQATHAEHVRLNHHPLLNGITRPGYPYAHYATVLVAYFHFYSVFEAAIDEALSRLALNFDYTARRKLPWLAEDLGKLGIEPDSIALKAEPGLRAPSGMDVSQLFGVLYTIEGSTLGGKVIAGNLAENCGLSASNGGRFFAGYGDAIDTCWREFTNSLESHLVDAPARSQACDAARQTFTAMEQVLNDYANRRIG
jgi:heme oxygenase